MKASTLEHACLALLSILTNCATLAPLYKTTLTPITYIDANIPDNDKRLYIPLTSEGINILFETRVPTQQELDHCPHVNQTSDTEWNPTEVQLPNASNNTQHLSGLQCSVLHT